MTLNNIHAIDEIKVAQSTLCSPDNLHKHVSVNSSDLTIISQNICSVYKNLPDLQLSLTCLKFDVDIIILTECRIDLNKPIPLLSNFTCFHTTNHLNQADGVVIYIKSSLKAEVKEVTLTHASCLHVILKNLSILGIYRSPSHVNATDFIDSVNIYLESIKPSPNIILTGDININLIHIINENSVTTGNRLQYLNMLASHGLLPGHTLPTRKDRCLDHFMIKLNANTKHAEVAVLDTTITDHSMIFLKLSKTIDKNSIRSKTKIIVNYEKALELLKETNLPNLITTSNPVTLTKSLINCITKCLTESTIFKPIPCNTRLIKPWMTIGMLRCIRNRNAMQRKLKCDPENTILKITYRRYRNYSSNAIKQLKRKYDAEQLTTAKKHPRKLWKTIDNITNRKERKAQNLKLLECKPNPQESVDHVNHYFANVGKSLAEEIVNDTSGEQHSSCSHYTSFVLLNTDNSEVFTTLMNLRSASAPGWDNIPTMFLKIANKLVVPIITHLTNLCFEQGIFPPALKIAVITPIHKNGKTDDPTNYRPISVLTSISKIIEKILNSRLINYLNRYNLLSNTQFGFRSGRSTEDAVITLSSKIIAQVDNNQKCLAVFLDLKKAFDTVEISTLLKRLDDLGIRGVALELFKSYLSDRKQKVKLGDYVSVEEDMTFGVPQGSVLGPTLFLIYINSLCDMKLEDGHVFSYADDTAVVFTGTTWTKLFDIANKGINIVAKWLKTSLLTLNIAKTNYICFTKYASSQPHPNHQIKIHSCVSSLSCQCEPFQRVSTTKYLGVMLDQRLSWHPHIELTMRRVRNLVWVFKILKHVADPTLLKQIYVSLVQSVIGYCIPVWGGSTKLKFLNLERAQRCIIKVMHSKPFRHPTESLYSISDLLTVRKLYILHAIVRLHKSIPYDPHNTEKRLHYKVAPVLYARSKYAARQYIRQSAYLYNIINKNIHTYTKTIRECKITLTNWLKSKTYSEIEELLTPIS